MLEKVSRFLQENLPDLSLAPTLAAVSGGVDSVVLCDVLSRLGLRFGIAHCHFGLRAEDSDADESFVKELAQTYGVPFFSERFATKVFAQKEGVSIQMAARELRYQWFEQVREREGYGTVATAHHRNDAAETILLNLTRGTGLAGLHGIPVRNGHVVRPLLALTKAEILTYATERNLTWREDASNQTLKYQRNLIRHQVIPVLKQLNPNLEHGLHQTAERVRGAEQVVAHYVAEVRTRAVRRENDVTYLDLEPLAQVVALPLVLHELLRPFGFRYDQMADLITALPGIPGKTFLSPTHTLIKDRTCLVITPHEKPPPEIYTIFPGASLLQTPWAQLHLREWPAENYELNPDRHVAALDAGLLRYPLQLRPWAEADRFVPLGMRGKKKISDFLIDRKVPLTLKERVLVLVSGPDIVWVVGHRLDDRYKLTATTRQVLEVRQIPVR